jgi:hypothetical protein
MGFMDAFALIDWTRSQKLVLLFRFQNNSSGGNASITYNVRPVRTGEYVDTPAYVSYNNGVEEVVAFTSSNGRMTIYSAEEYHLYTPHQVHFPYISAFFFFFEMNLV